METKALVNSRTLSVQVSCLQREKQKQTCFLSGSCMPLRERIRAFLSHKENQERWTVTAEIVCFVPEPVTQGSPSGFRFSSLVSPRQ